MLFGVVTLRRKRSNIGPPDWKNLEKMRQLEASIEHFDVPPEWTREPKGGLDISTAEI